MVDRHSWHYVLDNISWNLFLGEGVDSPLELSEEGREDAVTVFSVPERPKHIVLLICDDGGGDDDEGGDGDDIYAAVTLVSRKLKLWWSINLSVHSSIQYKYILTGRDRDRIRNHHRCHCLGDTANMGVRDADLLLETEQVRIEADELAGDVHTTM